MSTDRVALIRSRNVHPDSLVSSQGRIGHEYGRSSRRAPGRDVERERRTGERHRRLQFVRTCVVDRDVLPAESTSTSAVVRPEAARYAASCIHLRSS